MTVRSSKTPGWHSSIDKGKRVYNEDTCCHGLLQLEGSSNPQDDEGSTTSSSTSSSTAPELLIAGCFDGHGGDLVSKHLAQHMASQVTSQLQGKDISSNAQVHEALSAAFGSIDQELRLAQKARLIGSTAVVAIVSDSMIHIASCGDSRAVICHGFKAIQPVEDHTPSREDELARIQKLGGHVLHRNGVRVMGALAMSRAIGDHALRPYGVTADPDIAHYVRCEGDEYLLLASDGLWNVLTNEDVACILQLVLSELTAVGLSRHQISALLPKLLTRVAMQRGSTDNVTVITLDVNQHSSNNQSSKPVSLQQQVADICPQTLDAGSSSNSDVEYSKGSSGVFCSRNRRSGSNDISCAALQRIKAIMQLVSASSWDSSKTAADLQAGRKLQLPPAAAAGDAQQVAVVPSISARQSGQPCQVQHNPAAAGSMQPQPAFPEGVQEIVRTCKSVGQQNQQHQQISDSRLQSINMSSTRQQVHSPQQQGSAQYVASSAISSPLPSPFEAAQQQYTFHQAVQAWAGQQFSSIPLACSPFSLLKNISCTVHSPIGVAAPQLDQMLDSAKKRRLVTTGSGEQVQPALQPCDVAGVCNIQPPSKMQRVGSATAAAVGAQSAVPVLRHVQPIAGWSPQDSTCIAMRASA